MKISINGNLKEIKSDLTILDLLKDLKKEPQGVVIELNGDIIKRDKWKDTKLKLNDKLEIISFVGGG